MKVQIKKQEAFTVSNGDSVLHGMFMLDQWEGLVKYGHPSGGVLIVNDGEIVKGSPSLLHDLKLISVPSGYILVPARTLPGGRFVPAFYVAERPLSKCFVDMAIIEPNAKPWVNINFADAKAACVEIGASMITESQWLSIALDIVEQDLNWTGGKVGEGNVYQGLHRGTVSGPQLGTFESPKSDERRWHILSNGSKVYDFAGHVWQWVFDDVQGDDQGIVAKSFADTSPSIATVPYPSRSMGMGYIPSPGYDWSGSALVRGGCWCSGDYAGVFSLNRCHPGYGVGHIGFRSTLPHSGL